MPKHIFKKGEGGRPKGVPNKTTRHILEINREILRVVKEEITVKELLSKCRPDTILSYIAKITPKDVRVNGEIGHNVTNPIIEMLEQMRKENENKSIIEAKASSIETAKNIDDTIGQHGDGQELRGEPESVRDDMQNQEGA